MKYLNAWMLSFVALAGAAAGCRTASFLPIGTVEGRQAAAGARKLAVRNNIGEIRIEAGPSAEVSVRAVVFYKGDEDDLPRPARAERDLVLKLEGDTLLVQNAHVDASDHNDWKMDLTITAPAALDIEVSCGVGRCQISGARKDIRANIGVGDIEVNVMEIVNASISTGVGRIELNVEKDVAPGEIVCKAGVGTVRIALPRYFAGEVSMGTGVGSISVENAPGLTVTRNVTTYSAAGKLGSSPSRLTATTGTGDIFFRLR